MKKLAVLFLVVSLLLSACQLSMPSFDTTPAPANAQEPAQQLEQSASTEPVLSESIDAPTEEPAQLKESGGCPARVVIEPPTDAYINREGNKTYSFSYKLKEDRRYDIPVTCGSTATISFGNATIDGKSYSAEEDEGNVVYSTCDQPLGCVYEVKDFTAGHVDVTVAYPGMEKPELTVYNAVSNMFEPSNCGGSGCNRAFMTDADDGKTTTFDSKPEKANVAVNGFAVEPTIGSVVSEPESKTITVGGRIVGYYYNLSGSGTQYVGVPEANSNWETGVAFNCPYGCTVYGTEIEAGASAIVYGNPGDKTTPEDLNWTVELTAGDLTSVQVYFVFADNIDSGYAIGNKVYEFNLSGLME